jgi:hypothetical protein
MHHQEVVIEILGLVSGIKLAQLENSFQKCPYCVRPFAC